MSKFWHTVIHIGAVALNVAQLASGVIPPPYNLITAAVLGGVQTAVGIYNHGAGKTS